MDAFLLSATFWVGVAFFGFIGLLLFYGVPKMVNESLDKRAETIREELDEAARLREEAQALLASYQRKQREAEKEAENIIAEAKAEAERMRKEADETIKDQIERRAKMAEDKIAQAETDAIADVRRVAADTATKAARELIKNNLDSDRSRTLVDDNIKALSKILH